MSALPTKKVSAAAPKAPILLTDSSDSRTALTLATFWAHTSEQVCSVWLQRRWAQSAHKAIPQAMQIAEAICSGCLEQFIAELPSAPNGWPLTCQRCSPFFQVPGFDPAPAAGQVQRLGRRSRKIMDLAVASVIAPSLAAGLLEPEARGWCIGAQVSTRRSRGQLL